MSRALLVVAVLVAAVCARSQDSEGAKGQVTLPVLGTVGGTGDVPDEEVFTFDVRPGGGIAVGGEVVGYDEWTAALKERARDLPDRRAGGLVTSRLNVVARVDRELPVAVVALLMKACARADIAAPRFFVGARHEEDGSEGAMALFLPVDRPRADGREDGGHVVHVRAGSGRRSRPGALHACLHRTLQAWSGERRSRSVLALELGGDVRWDRAARWLDAASRAGVTRLHLRCLLTRAQQQAWAAEDDGRDLGELVRATAVPEDGPALHLGPVLVGGDDSLPEAPGRVGGVAGFESPEGMADPVDFSGEHRPERIDTALRQPALLLPPPGKEGARARDRYAFRRKGRQRAVRDLRVGRAIGRGLQWLADHQGEDGRWDADGFMKHDDPNRGAPCDGPGNVVHDVGVTGLALLAFLGDGNTLRAGPHEDVMKKGIGWLREQQSPNGLIGVNASHDFIYDHVIATCAMVEAYGLSDYKLLKENAQKALDYLEQHRNPFMVWRYQPRGNDNDTSVTSWCVLACTSGQDFGLEVEEKAFEIAATWYDQVADPTTGRHGYSRRGELSSRRPGAHINRFPPELNEGMTGASLFVRHLLGQDPARHPIMNASADLIAKRPPEWKPGAGKVDLYAWFWCSHALYQHGGRHWPAWAGELTTALVESQENRGNPSGSWDPVSVWGEDGGRVYSTAMAVLALESFYRVARTGR